MKTLTTTMIFVIALISFTFTTSALADCQNLNSSAIQLAQPDYPVAARKAESQGKVVVHIEVNESGSVVFAEATVGPTLLREAAERAAMRSKFPPGKLSGDLTFTFVIEDATLRGIIPTKRSKGDQDQDGKVH